MMTNYYCKKCKKKHSKYYKNGKLVPKKAFCDTCKGVLERILGAPTSHGTQILDNGVQAKQVEFRDFILEQEENLVRGIDDTPQK